MVTIRPFVLLLAAVLISLLSTGQCDEKCEDNEEWNPCGTSCPKTCEHVANMTKPEVCTKDCNTGCECEEGYVRNKDGHCVPEEECPCHEHAFYDDCGTACPLTCDNYSYPAKECTHQCVPGCACEEGYVRLGKFGQCVLPEDCPKKA